MVLLEVNFSLGGTWNLGEAWIGAPEEGPSLSHAVPCFLLDSAWLPGICLGQLECHGKGLKFRVLAFLERPTHLQGLPEYISYRENGWVEVREYDFQPWEQNVGLHDRVVTVGWAGGGKMTHWERYGNFWKNRFGASDGLDGVVGSGHEGKNRSGGSGPEFESNV